MYLQSAWRALGKIYYHLLQIGNVKEFELADDEKENEEAEFRARQLLKITTNLREVAELYEYLGREVIQSGTLNKIENGCYSINNNDFYYCEGNLIEYYDIRFNRYDISTIGYDGKDYYIAGYPLQLNGTKVRVRGYGEGIK